MIIYSEITGETFASVDECLAAEKKHEEKKEYELRVKEAYERAMKACDEYLELVGFTAKASEDKNMIECKVEEEVEDEDFEKLLKTIIDIFLPN